MTDTIPESGEMTVQEMNDWTWHLESRLSQTQDELARLRKTPAEERAFQAETERDSWAQFATELAERLLVGPAADNENLPTPEGNDLAAIVETLFEDRSHGTPIDELDAAPLVRGWANR